MKTQSYHRSEIYSYYDLDLEQRKEALDTANDEQHAEERSYVLFGEDVLPLDMFMRIKNGRIWHGVYGMTAFSAYYIRINRSNDGALIAYRYS